MLWDVILGKLLKVIIDNRDSVLGFYCESNRGEYFCIPTRQKDSPFLYVYDKRRIELIRKIKIPYNLNWITKLELRNPKNRNWLARNIKFADNSFIIISANDTAYKWELKSGYLSKRPVSNGDHDYDSELNNNYLYPWWQDDTTYYSSMDGKLIYKKKNNEIFEKTNDELVSRVILKGKIVSPLYTAFDGVESKLLVSNEECLLILSIKPFDNQLPPMQVLPWQKIQCLAFDLHNEKVAMFSDSDTSISIRSANFSTEYLKIKTSKIIRELQYDSSGKFLRGVYFYGLTPGRELQYKALLWNAFTGDLIGEGDYWSKEMTFISIPKYDKQDPTKIISITIYLTDGAENKLVYDSIKRHYYYSDRFNKIPYFFKYTQLSDDGLWR
ncbi:MAG TPA: hypothetical protein V6C58_13405, partial [Allocoleopsis sp.]